MCIKIMRRKSHSQGVRLTSLTMKGIGVGRGETPPITPKWSKINRMRGVWLWAEPQPRTQPAKLGKVLKLKDLTRIYTAMNYSAIAMCINHSHLTITHVLPYHYSHCIHMYMYSKKLQSMYLVEW